MSTYVRPAVESPVFYDAQGQVIEYGSRWPDSPPVDTYSVVTHPERFDPLVDVAEALIAYLREAFEVETVEGPAAARHMLRPHDHATRTVRLEPRDPRCAPLTFQVAEPGVVLEAGLLAHALFPGCGCDACDATWDGEATELEGLALAVAEGRFRETLLPGLVRWVEIEYDYAEGGCSSRQRARDYPTERVKTLRRLQRRQPEGWAAWPQRIGANP